VRKEPVPDRLAASLPPTVPGVQAPASSQPKTAATLSQKLQAAPPVYRPQQIAKMMQAKSIPAQRQRAAGGPRPAPPAYRREPVKIAPPKAALLPVGSNGNQAAVQPFITKGTKAFYPDSVTFSGTQSKPNFERSLAVLGGPPQAARTAQQISWSDFARDHAKYALSAMGRPTGGTNQKKVKRQFEDQTTAYYYRSDQEIQSATPTSKHLLLSFADMAEEDDDAPLPASSSAAVLTNAKCVIEILHEWAINVPQSTNSSVAGWHDYSRGQGLDYRQDNHYIVLYVQKLGYPLINAKPIKWNDWDPAIGRYLVTSQDRDTWSGTGHMIGVTVAAGVGGKVKTITDTQGLSPGASRNPHGSFDKFKVCYIFRVS
jgi:hypothetical protein